MHILILCLPALTLIAGRIRSGATKNVGALMPLRGPSGA
ncbi:hypothetical protein RB2083_1077 [Rhodobacteraceae bacterium HTCC2083]|nr:hypothetical protein RB2083_1077 [Rhodobacteraceae bacterium HTCC2083]